MKKVKTFFWLDKQNFGDALNIRILNELFNIEVIKTNPEECEATFIGSTLDDFLYNFFSKEKYERYFQLPPFKIWGSGFICGKNKFCYRPFNLPEQYFRRAQVYAVRGKLSRDRLRNILHDNLEGVPLADPGLLISDLNVEGKFLKKYSVGIIPHFLENGTNVFDTILRRFEKSIIIDMTKEIDDIIRMISQCNIIISSSLHGLIAADSLGIPNIRIKATHKVNGGDFKYNDYYSSFGKYNVNYITIADILDDNIIERIVNNYTISLDMVSQKKKLLYECFPYKNEHTS